MLHRISYETLKKTAIYGAAFSVTGSFIFYYLIQSEFIYLNLLLSTILIPGIENLASGPYYTEAVKAMRSNRKACTLLGEPIRFQALRLGDKDNVVTTQHAQVRQCICLVLEINQALHFVLIMYRY